MVASCSLCCRKFAHDDVASARPRNRGSQNTFASAHPKRASTQRTANAPPGSSRTIIRPAPPPLSPQAPARPTNRHRNEGPEGARPLRYGKPPPPAPPVVSTAPRTPGPEGARPSAIIKSRIIVASNSGRPEPQTGTRTVLVTESRVIYVIIAARRRSKRMDPRRPGN